LKTVGYLCKNRGIFSFSGIFYEYESKKKNIYLKKIKSVFTVSFDQFNLYFFSAVKRLNAINRIQNKRFCLHNMTNMHSYMVILITKVLSSYNAKI